MPIAHWDFETRSVASLEQAGAWRYAADPTTEILCVSYAIDDGSTRSGRRGSRCWRQPTTSNSAALVAIACTGTFVSAPKRCTDESPTRNLLALRSANRPDRVTLTADQTDHPRSCEA